MPGIFNQLFCYAYGRKTCATRGGFLSQIDLASHFSYLHDVATFGKLVQIDALAVAVDTIGDNLYTCHVVDFHHLVFCILDVEGSVIHSDAHLFLLLFDGGALDVLGIHLRWSCKGECQYSNGKYLFL